MLGAIVFLLVLGFSLTWYLWEKHHRQTRPMSGGLHLEITLPHQHEYELYHNGLSLCSKKVRVCLKELQIPFAEHHIDLVETGSYEVLSRHFLKVNPAGLLPVLVHKGHPIYESHDIITYCAEQAATDAAVLLPLDNNERTEMNIWMDRASMKGEDPAQGLSDSAANCVAVLTLPLFCSAMQEIPYRKLFDGLLFHRIKFRPVLFFLLKLRGLGGLSGVPPLVQEVAKAYEAMGSHLDALEAQLAAGLWICGCQFTLADVSWMVIFERLFEADWIDSLVTPKRRPQVHAYWLRLQQRPSYAGISEYRLPIVDRATERIRAYKKIHEGFSEALTMSSQEK